MVRGLQSFLRPVAQCSVSVFPRPRHHLLLRDHAWGPGRVSPQCSRPLGPAVEAAACPFHCGAASSTVDDLRVRVTLVSRVTSSKPSVFLSTHPIIQKTQASLWHVCLNFLQVRYQQYYLVRLKEVIFGD